MRRTLILAGVFMTVVTPHQAAATHVVCSPEDALGNGGGSCRAAVHLSIPGGKAGVRRPIELITAMSSTPETGACTILATPTSGQGQEELRFQRALDNVNDAFSFVLPEGALNRFWARVLANAPGCPSVSPREVAFSFLRQIVPPGPDPWIAPGYAITGKPAFLETRAPTAAAHRYDTPLGPLDVALRATTFSVDWGDRTGADTGPFAAPGRPWPHGHATHTYTVQESYDVTVTQSWDATWRLAGENGLIRGLSSVDRLRGFEARQLQAVRNQ